jgi:DNA mismatch repair ATPase MutS
MGEDIRHNANLVDELDLTMGFARTAGEMGYCRPTMTEGLVVIAIDTEDS